MAPSPAISVAGIDSVMMRLVDIIYSIPYMFILILLLIIFGRSFIMLFVGYRAGVVAGHVARRARANDDAAQP